MAVITSIKQQKGKQNRVNIYLDNKFGFGIDLDNFVLFNLKLNQELEERKIEEIVKKAEFQKTLDKLLRFALVRLRSEKEIRDYLYRKKVPNMIWNDLFAKLKNLELIDDTKFAKWWIEIRQSFSPKSKRVLNNELQIKGINKEIITEALKEIDIDEEKIAVDLLNKKRFEDDKKRFAYLVRKGFDFEIAKKAIRSYNSGHD